MARARSNVPRRRRIRKILKASRGYQAGRGRLYRTAKTQQIRSQMYAFFGRKGRKRDFRALWITRIHAALYPHDISYSRFIHGLKKSAVGLNRKALADLAVSDPEAFARLVELAKAATAEPRPAAAVS